MRGSMTQMSELSQKYGEKHPKIIQLNRRSTPTGRRSGRRRRTSSRRSKTNWLSPGPGRRTPVGRGEPKSGDAETE